VDPPHPCKGYRDTLAPVAPLRTAREDGRAARAATYDDRTAFRDTRYVYRGPYLGLGSGYFALIRPAAGWDALQPLVLVAPHFRWNLSPWFSLELGYAASLLRQRIPVLGAVDLLSLHAVTLDARVPLLRASRHRLAVPYLQAGLGTYFLRGRAPREGDCGKRWRTFAAGGGLQLGAGLDLHLTDWMALGLRALYRPLFMSGLRCADPALCADPSAGPGRPSHSVSGEAYLSFSIGKRTISW
jgi:hypothetical protein